VRAVTVARVTTDAQFLPGRRPFEVAVAAPRPGPQQWAGAPSAVREPDGSFVLSYRRRDGAGVDALVFARSVDGVHFETTAELFPASAGAAMTERASLHRLEDGHWRMYASFATPDSLHWWVGQADAASAEALAVAPIMPVFVGNLATMGFKDPVVLATSGRWLAYLCGHPLDVAGAEDRMITHLAGSTDGRAWSKPRPVLAGRPDAWDARGARVTAALPGGSFAYDGRASAEENWFEKTGVATAAADGTLEALDVEPAPLTRYLDLVALPDGSHRVYYETTLPDESHELRTELVAPA
jgi:hypothetical protein